MIVLHEDLEDFQFTWTLEETEVQCESFPGSRNIRKCPHQATWVVKDDSTGTKEFWCGTHASEWLLGADEITVEEEK